jgi:hypothetical protein
MLLGLLRATTQSSLSREGISEEVANQKGVIITRDNFGYDSCNSPRFSSSRRVEARLPGRYILREGIHGIRRTAMEVSSRNVSSSLGLI